MEERPTQTERKPVRQSNLIARFFLQARCNVRAAPRHLLAWAALFACLLQTPWCIAQERVALVIGNAAYRDAPLRNPINDARAMRDKLGALGFRVMLVENGNKNTIERAVLSFTETLSPTTIGLFYYAGHGVQSRGRNFIVPIDADFSRESALRVAAVDISLLVEEMSFASNRMNIIILDACRNNPFERRFRSVQRGLARIEAGKNMIVAYSTAPGAVAADGAGRNGLYTVELLDALEVPGLKIEEVFKRVRVRVAEKTGDNQIPWESSALTDDFVFNANPASPQTEVVASTSPANGAGTTTPVLSPSRETPAPSVSVPPPVRPATTTEPATSSNRQVLIAPFAANITQDWSEKDLADVARAAVARQSRYSLAKSYYHDRDYYDSIARPGKYWQGANRKTPDVDALTELAAAAHADAVVAVAYDGFSDSRHMGDPSENLIQVFVVDVKSKRLFQEDGLHKNLDAILARLLTAASQP